MKSFRGEREGVDLGSEKGVGRLPSMGEIFFE